MIQYWHFCGGWHAMWRDATSNWQSDHDCPYLSLCLLKRHYPYGYVV